MASELRRAGYEISTDPGRIDLELVHDFLNRSYWAAGVSRQVVARSLAGSLVFGVYSGAEQVGMARVITDQATFAYLTDLFILEAHRGRGLGRWLVQSIHAHPTLQGLRRWMLVTHDAQEFYRALGYRNPPMPERILERIEQDDCARRQEST